MTSNPIDPFAPPPQYSYGGPAPHREETQELPLVPPDPPYAQAPPVETDPAATPQPFPSPANPGPAPFYSPQATPPSTAPPQDPPTGPPRLPGYGGGDGDGPRKSGKTWVVAVVVAVVVLALGAGLAVYLAMGSDEATLADPRSSESAEDEKSDGKDSDGKEEPGEESAKPSEEASSTADAQLAGRPTKFGAWWAGDGKYEGKWEKPDSDGGQEITSYLVADCEGDELATVDANTYHVAVEIDELKCMSVQAVTAAGPGEVASFDIRSK